MSLEIWGQAESIYIYTIIKEYFFLCFEIVIFSVS